jgi:hypothetical protein
MNTHEVLVKASNLIADEKDWCGRGWGSEGQRCAWHALFTADGTAEHGPTSPLVRQAVTDIQVANPGMGLLGKFNDSHSHAEVLAAFDKAIASTAPQPDTSFLAEVEEAIPA